MEREGWFATTHWSVILAAQNDEAPGARDALDHLCQTYWYPLYAFIRRQGFGSADAEDLTQEFFASWIRRDSLRTASPDKGRFRSFLLVAVKRFLINQHERAHAVKRGGAAVHVPIDTEIAETRYQAEPQEGLTAERAFERRWTLTVLDGVIRRLKGEAAARGKVTEFEALKAFLTVASPESHYAEAGARVGLSEGAARVAVHRLRRRFRELFREEIARTVAQPDEIDDEIRHLLASLGG